MIEEIVPEFFRIEVPIPNSPLKATNAYLIRGDTRNLLVDTGINNEKSLTFLRSSLDELAIDLGKTDIFVTHRHADHFGLVSALKTNTSILYATESDAADMNDFLTAEDPFAKIYNAASRNGLSHEEAMMAIKRHPANGISFKQALDFTIIAEGSILTVGDYCFTCIETPGHTKGHVCLYEASKKILIAGDHLLGDISPNITCWGEGNPLGDFLASLKKISDLPVDIVLPGHRRIFKDCEGRICQLLEHHRQRADEAFAILGDGPMTGYEVAARMTWDMVYNSWADVAPAQKFFATGEALSHLRYLECKGLIHRATKSDHVIYWR